jgi:hypothetical protein
MTAGKSLKEQNAWLIRTALVVHVLAFAYLALEPLPVAQFLQPEGIQKLQAFVAPGSISLGLIALTRLVLLGMIPAQVRDRLIHWRWTNPLPGARAFTKYGPADQRVDMKKIEQKYGAPPAEPAEQSRLFYSIYRKHADDAGVLDAHKSYLATRDIGTINLLLFIVLVPVYAWYTQDCGRTLTYAALLFAAYALMCVAAQIYAVRFVQNALASASH